jgi:hypothetical protein
MLSKMQREAIPPLGWPYEHREEADLPCGANLHSARLDKASLQAFKFRRNELVGNFCKAVRRSCSDIFYLLSATTIPR